MPATTTAPYDVAAVRADIPILAREVHGRPLVYLDHAATSQKPRAVIERITRYYETENANVHRGVHTLSQEATDAFEAARRAIQAFVNAPHAHEVILTRGTTEAANLVAHSFGEAFVREGDEIVVTELEHHANIVPWQLLAARTGAVVRVLPMTETGELDLDALPGLLTDRTRLVAVSHTSNALGTVTPLEQIVPLAKAAGAAVFVDAAQAAPHAPLDVQALGADFVAFSGHKMGGPTGIGVLWGREALLESMPPFMGGGDMIAEVRLPTGTTFNALPHKFEAGTPHIAGAVGLHAAVDYLSGLGMANVAAHEADVLGYALGRLAEIDGLRLVGTPRRRAGSISFLVGAVHPYDVGSVLDRLGVAVRTGQHCAQPIMDRLGVPGTVRASFGFYSSRDDADALVDALGRVQTLFG